MNAPLHLDRRGFLTGSAAAVGAIALTGTGLSATARAETTPTGATGPAFLHSVASGDPTPNAVVIWTRVTPTPDALPGSGLGARTAVRWEVATDPAFTSVAASGSVTTGPERDHTVKVDVTGLHPATAYHYRFTVVDGPAQGQVSRIGRTHTAPAVTDTRDRMRFAVCSCSNYEAGWFTAYRHMADRGDLDLVLHLGDYTYEYAHGDYTGAYGTVVRDVAPAHRTTTVADYRIRLGVYRQDADLADLHALVPFVCMWDDHEVTDNWWRAGTTGDNTTSPAEFPALLAAARQAYFEWMPVRPDGVSEGSTLYRRFQYGSLVELIVPDLRSYRDEQLSPGGDWIRRTDDPTRTLTGARQYEWLRDSVTTSTATWQVVGTELMISPITIPATVDPQVHEWLVKQVGLPQDGLPVKMDQWDGYPAERRDLIRSIHEAGRKNVVFVTGDIHTSWVSSVPLDVPAYRANPAGATVAATEFIAPSICAASVYDTVAKDRALAGLADGIVQVAQDAIPVANPWFQATNLKLHGYGVIDITPERARMDWCFVDTVLTKNAPVRVGMSWQANAGSPGAVPAPGPLGAHRPL